MFKRFFFGTGLVLMCIFHANSGMAQECNPLSMTSMAAPPGTVGVAYKHKIQSFGGKEPISMILTAGVLPAGLSLFDNGEISGKPRESGSFTLIIEAADSCKPQQQSATRTMQLIVSASGKISPANQSAQLRKVPLKVKVITSPSTFSIPAVGAVERKVSYTLTSQPAETATLNSLGGTFTVAGAVIESVKTPLTATFINGKSALTETIIIPPKVLEQARRDKGARIVYSRAFSGRGTTALGIVEFRMIFE